MGLAILLWGTSAAFGQDLFRGIQCDPCEPIFNPCDPCGGSGGHSTPLSFGGWFETGIYTNSHGSRSNGPMHPASKERTDFQLNQFNIFAEKEMNTRRGFDWGARADVVYGTDTGAMWCFGDQTFDYGWGLNRHGYGVSLYQLYGTLGYKDWSVKVGKFIGCVGWEAAAALDNTFYSRSYCYWIEPATHSGVLATYDVSERLSLSAGWTAGADCSFQNRYGDNSVLSGLALTLFDGATVHYWINAGKEYNGNYRGVNRFGDADIMRNDYFVQSVVLEWDVSKRFTYICQYNLRNDNFVSAGGTDRVTAYGINNHFLYKLTDKLTAGTRVEWLRDNAGFFGNHADYTQVTLGLRWDATKNVSFRPEVRYDSCKGSRPFAGGTRSTQVSGGGGMLISF